MTRQMPSHTAHMLFLVLLACVASSSGFISSALQRSINPLRSSPSPPSVKMAANGLKVGVIGCGRIGQTHLEALAGVPSVTPVMIMDVVEPVLESLSEQYGVATTKDPLEVINNPEVEAVWICSPSQFHADQIKACAAAGKHVFCEKPLATDLGGTMEAVAAAEKAGIKLMTAFQRRYDRQFAAMHAAIAAGEIGTPLQAILQSRDPSPPPFSYVKGGGGIFKDMAIHDLDIAVWMMSAAGPNPPVTLYATGSCNFDKEIESLQGSSPSEAIDTAQIQITFSSGTSATINVCRQCSYGYDQRVEVFGSEGALSFGNEGPNAVEKKGGNGIGLLDKPYDFFMSRYAAAYQTETQSFARALSTGETITPDGQDGILSLRMAMACDLSLKEGRPVQLSEI